jgi:hypothetical protein
MFSNEASVYIDAVPQVWMNARTVELMPFLKLTAIDIFLS